MNAFALQIVNGFGFGLGLAVAVAVLRAIFHFGFC